MYLTGDEYKDMALSELLKSISNRRLIQYLRLELYKNIDFEPKNLESLNLIHILYYYFLI